MRIPFSRSFREPELGGQSDGGNHSFSADDAFTGHNMDEICKETGAELVNLSKIRFEDTRFKSINKEERKARKIVEKYRGDIFTDEFEVILEDVI